MLTKIAICSTLDAAAKFSDLTIPHAVDSIKEKKKPRWKSNEWWCMYLCTAKRSKEKVFSAHCSEMKNDFSVFSVFTYNKCEWKESRRHETGKSDFECVCDGAAAVSELLVHVSLVSGCSVTAFSFYSALVVLCYVLIYSQDMNWNFQKSITKMIWIWPKFYRIDFFHNFITQSYLSSLSSAFLLSVDIIWLADITCSLPFFPLPGLFNKNTENSR